LIIAVENNSPTPTKIIENNQSGKNPKAELDRIRITGITRIIAVPNPPPDLKTKYIKSARVIIPNNISDPTVESIPPPTKSTKFVALIKISYPL